MLATLIAACAGCTPPKHAPGHQAAAANRPSVAGPASARAAPASSAPTPSALPSPAAPARHGPRAKRRKPGTAPRPAPYGVGCQPAALRLGLGPRVSEATQQETVLFTLTNISGAGCDLYGYPGVSLLTRDGLPLPFRIRWGGDQMLTSAAPVLVPLAPGRTAYVGINKNACVGHEYHTAHLFQLIPPNDYQPLYLTTPHYPYIGYCPAGDPGHIVDISPVEPSLRRVMHLP